MLKDKKIVLGITGSIAAYKSAILTRLLVKSGAEVQIISTDAANEFITPLTLSTLSKKPVLSSFQKDETGEWNNHVELGLWADLILIAPASANTIAKCAHGICDNLLIATYLSAKCPVAFAPAMDLDMYQHQSTKDNLDKLKSYGNIIFESASGELASGLSGQGRMQEPEDLLIALEKFFNKDQKFKGKKVLITAGPTYEAIDPVRFIGNHSSGKMGYAIASAFKNAGAEVTLITGPTNIDKPIGLANIIEVTSAEEMHAAADKYFSKTDIAVLSAAVADYKAATQATEKIKKTDDSNEMMLKLVKTPDIAKSLGAKKKAHQQIIGFALETENEESNAKKKLQNKNFDLIVLNSLRNEKSAFGYDTNQVKIFDKNGLKYESALLPKSEIAQIILEQITQE
ncbi:bifunctional phosphopantothenoylcysteine decarboxylase/phosphopantothenate--cysteine ligase CoaBC [Marivirga atlantica]|uniref:Coenzyme A biosynthesis bifunctional protein CoaBC n=1 Tax=Marivirga atlantica TaxID=1548457 RepID=A0A937AKU9_9BACT|nr:bifunctional phosphopantothenoylcysteine decarboxylase/phosphopantothenate--cysteine ligase CoaBC [Marivirga atlantica]MBL0765403.1 bifunctional phosphopantothenoylcysteine decarboxylase/phosphopantothenate--cysteine ligase CoaBC [Marivirga atlantica]